MNFNMERVFLIRIVYNTQNGTLVVVVFACSRFHSVMSVGEGDCFSSESCANT